ncbi:hypothetical protein D3C87_2049420 [compost metagenome]
MPFTGIRTSRLPPTYCLTLARSRRIGSFIYLAQNMDSTRNATKKTMTIESDTRNSRLI